MVVCLKPCKSRSPPGALYRNNPSSFEGGFFFVCAQRKTRNRSPPGALYRNNPSSKEGGFFFACDLPHQRDNSRGATLWEPLQRRCRSRFIGDPAPAGQAIP